MTRLLETTTITAISHLGVVAQWDRDEAASAIYTPPPGWVVVQTRVDEHSSNSGSSEVSIIGGGLNLVTEEVLSSAFDAAIELAAKKNDDDLSAKLQEKKTQSRNEVRKYAANMNTIQAIVRASGSHNFFDRKRGWQDITVTADIAYIGSPDLNAVVASIEQEFGIDVPGLGDGS
jgi:hypothetical protein